jgi:hypothetical protein
VVAAAVAAVVVVAGVDVFRSSGKEPSASATTSTTDSERTLVTLPRCAPDQTEVTLEFRGRVATNVVRHVNGGECVLPYLPLRLRIEDQAGIEVFARQRSSALWGLLPPGSVQDLSVSIPDSVPWCAEGGPFQARVTVGSYSAQRKVSGGEIGCGPGGVNSLTRAEYIDWVDEICAAASDALRSTEANLVLDWNRLDNDEAVWSEAAARGTQNTLTALRTVTPPKRDRAVINHLLSLMAKQIRIHRKAAEAIYAGQIRRALPILDVSLGLEREKNRLDLDADLQTLVYCP